MNNKKVAHELVSIAKSLIAFGETDYSKMSINEIAEVISKDWKPVNYAAKSYLEAMFSMQTINDSYGMDDGKGIVLYFLSNSRNWKGEVAKAVKKELNKRLK